MKREILFSIFAIFGDFLVKNIDFLSNYRNLQTNYNNNTEVTSYYSEDLLVKSFLSSIAFSHFIPECSGSLHFLLQCIIKMILNNHWSWA